LGCGTPPTTHRRRASKRSQPSRARGASGKAHTPFPTRHTLASTARDPIQVKSCPQPVKSPSSLTTFTVCNLSPLTGWRLGWRLQSPRLLVLGPPHDCFWCCLVRAPPRLVIRYTPTSGLWGAVWAEQVMRAVSRLRRYVHGLLVYFLGSRTCLSVKEKRASCIAAGEIPTFSLKATRVLHFYLQ